MSDKHEPAGKSFDFAAAAARFMTDQTEYRERAANLDATNKAALFDILAAAGISHVFVTFDGYGDSGQIESIDARADDKPVALPSGEVTIMLAQWGQAEPSSQTMSVAEAIEHLAYDFLERTHCGWENNDGADGDFTFAVAKRSITLDYNEHYTASEHHSHTF